MAKKQILAAVYLVLFIVSFSKLSAAKSSYLYDLSVCAIFRDEARFLKEWIEFHRLVGVEHFWLFNNLSSDDYEEILADYIQEGVVELLDWPYESADWEQWHEIQNSAYEEGIRLAKGKTLWLAFIDTDEFLFPVKKKKLTDLLKEYKKFGAICVNWQLFGTSGVKRVPEDRLMIEVLLWKAERNDWRNYYVKSIVRPERVRSFPSAHFAYFHGKYYSVDTKKKRFVGCRTPQVLLDKLCINHYWTRDEDFFFEKKIDRRDKPGSNFNDFFQEYESLHVEKDISILRFVPQLRKRLSI